MERMVFEILTNKSCVFDGEPYTLYGFRVTEQKSGLHFMVSDITASKDKICWFIDLAQRNHVSLDEMEAVLDNAFWHKDC